MADYSEYIKKTFADEKEDGGYTKYIESKFKDEPKPRTVPAGMEAGQPTDEWLNRGVAADFVSGLGEDISKMPNDILAGAVKGGVGLVDVLASVTKQTHPGTTQFIEKNIQKPLGEIKAGAEILGEEYGMKPHIGKTLVTGAGSMAVDIPLKYAPAGPLFPLVMAFESAVNAGDRKNADAYADSILKETGTVLPDDERSRSEALVDILKSGGKSGLMGLAMGATGKLVKPLPKVVQPYAGAATMGGLTKLSGGSDEEAVAMALTDLGLKAKGLYAAERDAAKTKSSAPPRPVEGPMVEPTGDGKIVHPGGAGEGISAEKPVEAQIDKFKSDYGVEKYENLKSDIDKNGLKEPIQVLVDPSGKEIIYDGEHRYTAMKELGKEIPPEKIQKINVDIIEKYLPDKKSWMKFEAPTEPTRDIIHGGVGGEGMSIEELNAQPAVRIKFDSYGEPGRIKAGPGGEVRAGGAQPEKNERIFIGDPKTKTVYDTTNGVPIEVTDPKIIKAATDAGVFVRHNTEAPENIVSKSSLPTAEERAALGIKDVPTATGEMKNRPRSETVKPADMAAPKPTAVATEGVPPIGSKPPTTETPKQKISQVVTNTFAKEFGGVENALKLAEGFAEYPTSNRKEQLVRVAGELLNNGLEKSSQDLLKKETWDDYDLIKSNEIRKAFQRNAKSPEDLDGPLFKGILKKSKESYSQAGKNVQAAAEVDPITDPVRAAEQKVNEQIDEMPHLRRAKQKAKATVRKVKENMTGINKQAVEKNLDQIVLNVTKLLRREMKVDGVKLRDIIRKHYSEIDRTGEGLSQKIIRGLGINEHDAQIAERWVADAFGVLTTSSKRKVLNGMLGGSKKNQVEPDVLKKIVELSNLGAMDEAQFADVVARRMGVPVLTPDHMFKISKQAQRIQEMPSDTPKQNEAIVDEIGRLYSMLYTDAPKTRTQKAMDIRVLSMLLNFKSAERNVVGQGLDTVATSVSKSVLGIGVDKLMTKMLTKRLGYQTERTVTPTDFKFLFKNIFKAWGKGNKDVWKDIDTLKPAIEREYGVKLGKDADKFGVGRPEWKKGSIPDMARRGVAYLLQAPDRGFQEGVFRESYNNQLNALRQGTRNNLTQEMKQKMVSQAWREASTVTYRKMNSFSNMIVGLQQKMGTIGKLILTFPKVASNILYSGVYQYSPIGLGVSANGIRKFVKSGGVEIEPKTVHDRAVNQRQLALDFSRGGMGTALMAVGVLAGYTAAVTGGKEEDRNVQKTKEALGKQPGAIRIGKHYWRFDWAQPLTIPLEIGVEIGKAIKNKNDDGLLEGTLNVLAGAAESIVDQPLLTTLNRMTSAPGETPGKKALAGAEALMTSSFSSWVPTLSNQARQFIDKYQRNVFSKFGEGETNKLKAWGLNSGAMILNKIPLASMLLERRKDILGRDMQYHQSGNLLFDALDRFANPSIVTDYKKDPGIEFVLKLNEDRPKGMREKPLPRLTEKTWYIERDKKRYYMTPAQRGKYQELVGKDTYDFIQEYYKENANSGAPTEDMIKDIYDEISRIGKQRREEMLEELSKE